MHTFEKHLKPVYYICKLVGIFHFNLYDGKERLSGYKCQFLWSACFVAYFSVHSFMQLKQYVQSHDISDSSAFRALSLTIICIIKFCLDLVWFVIVRDKIKTILIKINAICKEFGIYFEKSWKSQVNLFGAVLITGILGILNEIFETEHLLKGRLNIELLIGIMNYAVFQITTAIRCIFFDLNRRIQQMQRGVKQPPHNFDFALKKMNKYAEAHFKLTEIARELNGAFSLPLLSTTGALFVFVTICTFHIISLTFTLHEMNAFYFYEIGKSLYWDAFFIGQFFIMVHSWNSIVKEANETGLHVHKIWNLFEENRQPSNIQEEEIDTISLQLLQTKLNFTVCRFVDLDWSLIHLVIQTVTMYLVWIIQLRG